MPATRAGTENKSTNNNTSVAVPQPKGKGNETQDVNDVDATSEPSDDEACDADVVCRYCETWRNMEMDSEFASQRWLKKREKKKEAQAKKSEK